MNRRPPQPRRSSQASILLAVLIAIVLAALAGVTLVAVADAQLGGTSVSVERDRLRALAWSGVRVAMARAESQRKDLLAAGRLDLPEILLDLESGSERLEARLLPLDAVGTRARPENAKIDANRAVREVLAKIPALGEDGADRLIAARGTAANLDELGAKAGFTHADLQGDAKTPGLSELLTVFSFDPATQTGTGAADSRTGYARIPFPADLSDRGKDALRQRLGEPAALAVQALSKDEKRPTSPSELFIGLSRAKIPLATIDAALDLFTFSPDPYTAGLVNINEASAAVLQCLPGLDAAAAERIVSARETIDARRKAKISWVLAQGAATQQQYRAMLDSVTTRSMQWRMRIEASIRPRDTATPQTSPGQETPLPSGRRLVLEVVIDVAGTRARIASMKDVTYLDFALAALAASAKDKPTGSASGFDAASDPENRNPQDEDYDEPEPPPEDQLNEPPPAEPEPPPPTGPPAPARDPRLGRWRAGK